MRRKDREISREEALLILEKCEYGVLGMTHTDGAPYTVPVNYCVLDGTVYFHSAMEGTKIDSLVKHPQASFCVVGDTEVLPSSFGSLYESTIVRGRASEAEGSEKQKALEAIIRKYSRDFHEEGMKYIDKLTAVTRVFGISMDDVTGKARRKKA